MALTLFLQFIQSKIDLLIISDRLCLSALIFCTVSAIGISVKSHIGASLVSMAMELSASGGNTYGNIIRKTMKTVFQMMYWKILASFCRMLISIETKLRNLVSDIIANVLIFKNQFPFLCVEAGFSQIRSQIDFVLFVNLV